MTLSHEVATVLRETGGVQPDNDRQAHLVHLLFYSLGGPSQNDRPVSRPSPDPIVSWNCFETCNKGVRVRFFIRLCTVGP